MTIMIARKAKSVRSRNVSASRVGNAKRIPIAVTIVSASTSTVLTLSQELGWRDEGPGFHCDMLLGRSGVYGHRARVGQSGQVALQEPSG